MNLSARGYKINGWALRLSVKFMYIGVQRWDTFETESDPERCCLHYFIEMIANIHSAASPIHMKDIENFRFLSIVDL